MSKQTEKLKKQLIEISEVVNLFKSEAVQVKVIDRLFDVMIDAEKYDADTTEPLHKRGPKQRINGSSYEHGSARKKPGATKVLNQLLGSDFFAQPHSISDIADYCKDNFDSDFKTSELSGILLKLAKENKLKRERSNENNRFEYVAV